MRELNVKEIKQVNGGIFFILAFIYATRNGNHNSNNMSAATNRL